MKRGKHAALYGAAGAGTVPEIEPSLARLPGPHALDMADSVLSKAKRIVSGFGLKTAEFVTKYKPWSSFSVSPRLVFS